MNKLELNTVDEYILPNICITYIMYYNASYHTCYVVIKYYEQLKYEYYNILYITLVALYNIIKMK